MDKPLDKEAIRKALEAASPGPWVPYWDGVVQFFNVPNGAYMFPADDFEREDAHLITHAPTWIRALLEENERLTEENNLLTKERNAAQNFHTIANRTAERLEAERDKYHKLAAELATEQKYAKEQALQAEQERDAYREALEWYADEINYAYTKGNVSVFSVILSDSGDRARQTLAQYSKGDTP